MENQTNKKGIPFKEFLDKTTNLVTLFGVFNALFIYSISLDNEGSAEFLVPSFFYTISTCMVRAYFIYCII